MFDLAIFKLIEGPAPKGVAFSGVPVIRKKTKGGVEVIELQHVRFTGATIEEVRAKAAAQDAADRERAERQDRSLREAAERRRAKKAGA